MAELDRKRLYTGSYTGLTYDDLLWWADLHDAVVVDTRLNPFSRDEQYSRMALQRGLGRRYVWVKGFGNANYRSEVGPVVLHAPETGWKLVEGLLGGFDTVLLICGCWNPQECHRKDVAEFLAVKTGREVWHLWRKELKAPPPPPEQRELFG